MDVVQVCEYHGSVFSDPFAKLFFCNCHLTYAKDLNLAGLCQINSRLDVLPIFVQIIFKQKKDQTIFEESVVRRMSWYLFRSLTMPVIFHLVLRFFLYGVEQLHPIPH